MTELFERGGPVIWVLAMLSVAVLTVILWKFWQLTRAGVWRSGTIEAVLAAWRAGQSPEAVAQAGRSGDAAAQFVTSVLQMQAETPGLQEDMAERTTRKANRMLRELRAGLRLLETAAMLAPLLGLFGTVLGMIDAFRTLEQSGGSAEPATLAGGIWEALLTTAFGMAVAVMAGAMLALFDAAVERTRHRMEDAAAEILARPPTG